MSRLVPAAGRAFFFELVANDAHASYELDRAGELARQTAAFLARQRLYSRQAIATLEVGLGLPAARVHFAEAARAGKLYVEAELPRPQPFHSFMAFFGMQVVRDDAALEALAKTYLDRTSPDPKRKANEPRLDALLRALAASIAKQPHVVKAALAGAKKLPRKAAPKTYAPWFAALTALAEVCLTAKPRDLSSLLVAVVSTTKAHFTLRDVRDQIFEPWLNRIALAFVARARDRGFDIEGKSPDPSICLELLRLPPSRLPDRAWWKWPKPSMASFKKLRDEGTARDEA